MRQIISAGRASLLATLFLLVAFSGCVDDAPSASVVQAVQEEPEVEVEAKPQLTAKFSYEGELLAGSLLTFTDESIVKNDFIDQRIWNFGGGNSDNGKTSMHVFDAPGTYTVTLNVITEAGLDRIASKTLKVVAPPVETEELLVNFTYEINGLDVTFSPVVSGQQGKVNYYWDYGDGDNSQLKIPTHRYDTEGYYRVILTVEEPNARLVSVTSYLDLGMKGGDRGEGGGDGDYEDGPAYDDAGNYAQNDLPHLLVEIDWDANMRQFSFFGQVGNAYGSEISYNWEFGDGDVSNEANPMHSYEEYINYTVTLVITADDGRTARDIEVVLPEIDIQPIPHVVVGIPDTGINPYHLGYFRPESLFHPCLYLEGYPCSMEALPLTVGTSNWAAAFNADQDLWADVKPGVWYWIPQTVFVAVMCEEPFDPGNGAICIFDDSHPHGTGTTSSVLTESPDALISFVEFAPKTNHWVDGGIPIDLVSVSWGAASGAPPPASGGIRPYPAFDGDNCGVNDNIRLLNLYIKSSGNDPGASTFAECWSGSPYLISVGGGQAADKTRSLTAYTEPDIVSYFCRPVYSTMQSTGWTDSCGTSFAGPTAAGGLAKVIYAIREQSGYTGNAVGDYYAPGHGYVDPILGITYEDLRYAMNITASYDPVAQYPNTGDIPINPEEPWRDWGWGFYDGLVADATIAMLLDGEDIVKDPAAVQFMADRHQQKMDWYG